MQKPLTKYKAKKLLSAINIYLFKQNMNKEFSIIPKLFQIISVFNKELRNLSDNFVNIQMNMKFKLFLTVKQMNSFI